MWNWFRLKTHTNMMPIMKIPRLKTNPAAGLIADILEHENVAASQAARDMHIPRSRLSDIFAGRKGVSADTALRLERYLGVSSALLLRLQTDFDFEPSFAGKV
jgi:addiction module HigA family antidote